jgi:hypothetical protein
VFIKKKKAMMRAIIIIFISLLVGVVVGDVSHLHIAGFFPTSMNVSEGAVGRGVLPAVKLAMFHINNDKRILKDYKLHITWNNTQVRYIQWVVDAVDPTL